MCTSKSEQYEGYFHRNDYILTINAMFVETKMISKWEEPTYLKTKHLFWIYSEMLAFVRGEFATGYFSNFCPFYPCCCRRDLSLLQYNYFFKK